MQPGTIIENTNLKGGYYRIRFFHPDIAATDIKHKLVVYWYIEEIHYREAN